MRRTKNMFSSPGGGGAGDRPSAKPSVANWFSSLRRQPKPKKSAVSKALQKSCVDLSQTAASAVAAVGSPVLSATPDDSRILAQTSNVWTRDTHKTLSGGTTATVSPPSTISRTETVQIDRQKRINTDVATTTTRVVQTTIITKQSHRVGLVFNDDGELMSKVDAFRNFTNSIQSQMGGGRLVTNGHRRNVNNNNSTSDSDSCRSSSFGGSSSHLDEGNDGEIEFIDSDHLKASPVGDGGRMATLAVGRLMGI